VDQASGLTFTISQQGTCRVAGVAGEIDIATSGALHGFLAHCLCEEAADRDLVVDMSGVTFMDARGLTALLRADCLARDLGVRLLLTALPRHVVRLLKLAGLNRRFAVRTVGADLTAQTRDRPGPAGPGGDGASAAQPDHAAGGVVHPDGGLQPLARLDSQ
jgi:anti-sigma B factor antagonist